MTNDNEDLTNDKMTAEGESYAIVDQELEGHDNEYLSFSIENLYDDEKEVKYRSPRKLKSSPPTLEVSSSNGDSVTFPLTKEFTKSLLRVITDVNFAYLGIRKVKRKLNLGGKLSPVEKVNDIFEKTKLSIILLALGMLLGISIAKSFVIGAVVSIILAGVSIMLHYSKENDKESVDKTSINEEENKE